jgi:hypothetical protein
MYEDGVEEGIREDEPGSLLCAGRHQKLATFALEVFLETNTGRGMFADQQHAQPYTHQVSRSPLAEATLNVCY